MLRILFITAGLALFCPNVKSQNLQWLAYFDSLTVFIKDMKTDVNNDVVVAGSFDGWIDFDPGPGVAAASSQGPFNSDGFVARYSSTGAFLWVTTTGSMTTENYDHLVLDQNGDIIVYGTFYGNYDMDPGPGTSTATLHGNQYCDIMLVRFTSSGSFIWGRAFGGTHNEFTNDMAIDANGNIIIVGSFTDECDLDPTAGVTYLYATGGNSDYDIFCSSFSSSGNFNWGWNIGTPASDNPYSVAVDVDGYVYIGGRFNGTIDFDPSPAQYPVTHSYAGFLAKYTPAGNFAWTKIFDWAVDQVNINAQQNVYLAMNYATSFDADPGAGTTMLPWVAGYEVGLICLDTAGNFLRSGSITGPANQMLGDADVDMNGNFYFCGQFESAADFDPGTGTTLLTPATWRDAFVVSVNAQLDLVWSLHIPCTGGEGYAGKMTTDNNGDYIVYGRFSGIADFDPTAATYTINSQSANMSTFLAKYSATTGVEETQNMNGVSVYPNPCSDVFTLSSEVELHNAVAFIIDARGRNVRTYVNLNGTSINFDVQGLGSGIYSLVLPEENLRARVLIAQ